jgi:UDP-glucose 4-epimerase
LVALVTGHCGFIGRHVATRLAADGWTVVGAGRPDVEIPSPEFDRLVAARRPQLVVHCAGPASVPASVADPEADRQGSVGVLESLLNRIEGSRLVLVSSAAVYGDPDALPIAEDAPLKPISPYGRHRVECERLARESGTAVAIARVFSAYGEGLRRQVLWDICREALDGGGVELAGTGHESRDFVHVTDVAAAVSRIAARSAFDGEAVNVAGGRETTIAELAGMLVRALGVDADVRFTGEARPGDPVRWRADLRRVRALGFEPEWTVEAGVAAYAAWARTSA